MPWGEPLSARARLEESMIDTIRFTEAPGEGDYDAETGSIVPDDPDEIYDGPCMITARDTVTRDLFRGGQQEHANRYQISVPYDAGTFTPGNVGTITGCVADPELVGRTVTVVAVAYGTGIARRRLMCDLVDVGVRR